MGLLKNTPVAKAFVATTVVKSRRSRSDNSPEKGSALLTTRPDASAIAKLMKAGDSRRMSASRAFVPASIA